MRMDETGLLFMSGGEGDAVLAAVNGRLAVAGLSITREDALMLAERRVESLATVERVEFGAPAVVAIAEAIVGSPFLMEGGVADALAELQEAFYALRDELPIDVPDAEIVEALRGCFDAYEGDAAEVAALPREEVMALSEEYRSSFASAAQGAYRIIDDEGRAYAFNPAEWDYDEQAEGWNGEEWTGDWDDEQVL